MAMLFASFSLYAQINERFQDVNALESKARTNAQIRKAKEDAMRNNQTRINATETEYLMQTSRPVDPDRYLDVRGTPFVYDDFGPTTLYDLTMNKYELDSVNLNAFTHQFEFYVDGQLRELNGNNYLRVTVPQPDGEHTYARGLNMKFRDKYARVLHRGDNVTATIVFIKKNEEKVVEDVGKTLRLRRFNGKSHYYAIVDGDFVNFKLSNKSLASDLGKKAELLKFMKANKLKVSREADLIKVLAEADRLYN